ncbi:MAG: response regulator transcription factor [Bacilli bacterium]|nr:response regulator transcription factor [Bacilli bacterium]
MKKILLVEDDPSIVKGLKYFLEQEGFNVFNVRGKKELNDAKLTNVGLVILDVSLPDANGFDLVDELKKNVCSTIIFLTAKDEEDDVVKGFSLGADDYVIKPFRPRELLSRINRVLRISNDVIRVRDVTLDKEANKVLVGEEVVSLTSLEYRVLLMLFENLNKVVTREALLSKIWDESGSFVNDNTLTVYVKRLRLKLPKDIIKTVKGIGYTIEKDGTNESV